MNTKSIKRLIEHLLSHLGTSYEIRIRITIGFMFLLIVIANLNSLRYFSQSRSLQVEQTEYRASEALDRATQFLLSNPVEKIRSTPFRDLASVAGFEEASLIETDVLSSDDAQLSKFIDRPTIERIRRSYSGEKKIISSGNTSLPAAITGRYEDQYGQPVRTVFYPFTAESGQHLTLVVNFPADIESDLTRFAILNAAFQLLSLIASLTIALILIKITLKPYREIKSQAIAADIVADSQPESVDFAVETFQRVIAELRQKEETLQKLYAQQREKAATLEQYNDYILGSMASGVISCDPNGMITQFNRAASHILGIPYAETKEQHYSELLANYGTIRVMIERALLEKQETPLYEIEMPLPGSGKLWLSLNCSLLKDSNEIVKGAMVLVSDLTEIKRLEAEIALKEHLALLGEMSAGLAHQLRNAMAAVVGFAQLLKKITAGQENSIPLVESILKEAKSTEEMLGRFLKLSRPDQIAVREILLAEIEEPLVTHFNAQLREKKVNLQFGPFDREISIVCDPLLLTNALINLIQNSIDASSEGDAVRIDIAVEKGSGDLLIIVKDQGEGMTPEQIPLIFTPFFTAGKPTGTGLGLSLARKWILGHQGDIKCQSAPGEGTTFEIRLPRNPLKTSISEKKREITLAKATV